MPAADDAMNVLGRLGQGALGGVLGVALPEMLKDAVEGMDGFDFLDRPLREAVAGIGEVFGTEIAKTVHEVTASVKTLWDIGGGAGMLTELTTAVGALSKLDPLGKLGVLLPKE